MTHSATCFIVTCCKHCLFVLGAAFQVSAENKISKNPFMQPLKIQSDQSNHISNALKNVPKIGDKKIAMLVERFGSLQSIAMASVEDLSLLGPGLAREVRDYFN